MDLDKIDELTSPQVMKYLLPALIGGGLGGTAGFLTSRSGGERPGETVEERRNRIIRNTLGMAAAGGLAGPALSGAVDAFTHAGTGVDPITMWKARGMTGAGAATAGATIAANAKWPVRALNKWRLGNVNEAKAVATATGLVPAKKLEKDVAKQVLKAVGKGKKGLILGSAGTLGGLGLFLPDVVMAAKNKGSDFIHWLTGNN